MMDFYDIIRLVLFFEEQSKIDYIGIKEVVYVLKHPEIPKENKGDIIVGILRKYGLDEVEYALYDEFGVLVNIMDSAPNETSKHFSKDVPNDIPEEVHWKKYIKGDLAMDLYVCNLINGEVRFYQLLN